MGGKDEERNGCFMEKREPLTTLTGVVVHGRGKGRKAGMPTANLKPDPGQALPPCGVYATLTSLEGTTWPGVTNVGARPSVDDDPTLTVETYLPDYAGDLYGRRLRVAFYERIRPVRKFASLEEVKRQVEKDAQWARDHFGSTEERRPGGEMA